QRSMSGEWPSGSDRGVKQAGFYVLRGAWMPSVLLEVAFISNPGEEGLLRDLDFRFRTARAIVAGIEAFANTRGR
ncbi:MAG TPA: N-acetylmuramoyl-L-alanine amidase, partial [Candidatus Fermentibacter sp.]|nr:N-acetylmuramoyl-L-alanine amidase [Candidatus Fermentibacter sp.]